MIFRKLLILAYLGGVLAVAGMAVFFAESYEGSLLIRDLIAENVEAQTGLYVTMGGVEVDALGGVVEVTDFQVDGVGAPRLAGASVARFGLAPLQLLAGTARVSTLDVDRPYINITIRDGHVVGLPQMPAGGKGGRLSERAFIRLFVDRFRMVGMDVHIRVEGKYPVDVSLQDLRAALSGKGAELHDGVFSLRAGTVTLPNGQQAHITKLGGSASLQGEGLLRPETLVIHSARAVVDGVGGDMQGLVRFAPLSTGLIPAADLLVAGHAPLAQFNDWVPGLLPMDGTVDVQAHLRSAFGARNPTVTGSGELKGVAVNEFTVGNWTSNFVADLSGVEFTDVRSDFAGADIRGWGRVDLAAGFKEATARFAASGQHASFAEGMENIRVPGSWVEFNVDADVEFEGTLWPQTSFAGQGDAVLTGFTVYNQSHKTAGADDVMMQVGTVRGHSNMDFDFRHFSFVDGTLSDGKTTVTGNVFLPFGLEDEFWVDAGAVPELRPGEVFDCATISPIGPVHLTCRGPGTVRVQGRYDNPRVWGSARMANVSIEDYQLGEAVGSFDYERLLLRFMDVRGRKDQTNWGGNATLNWRAYMGEAPDGSRLDHPHTRRETLFVTVHANHVDGLAEDIRSVIPPGWGNVMEYLRTVPVNGPVRGVAVARGAVGDGTVDDLTFETDFSLGAVDVYEQRFDHGHLSARMDHSRVTFDDATLHRGQGTWQAQGTVGRADAAVRIDARVANMQLAQLDALSGVGQPVGGSFDALINARGAVGDWQGPVRLDVHGVTVGQIPIGNGGLDLMMGGGRIKGAGPVFDGRSHLDWDMKLEPPWEFKAVMDAERGPAQDLVGANVLPRGVTLTFGGHAVARGALSHASKTRGQVTLTHTSAGYKRLAAHSDGPIRFSFAGDRVNIQRLLMLTDDGVKADLKGNASSSALDLDLEMAGDLAAARWFVDSVHEAYGPIWLNLSITGTPDEPVLIGQGQMQGGRLVIDGFRHHFNDIETNIAFIRDRIVMDPLTFQLDESPARGNAEVQLRGLAIQNITLNARFQNLRFRVPDYLPSELSGSITMTGDGKNMLLTGDVDVLETRYQDPWEWEQLTDALRRRRLAPKVYDKDKEWLTLDVHLRANDRIYVKNGTMDAEFRGDMQLTGTNERTGLLGTLTGLGGRAVYRNNVFELGRSTVDFTERHRVAVNVDVEAQSRIKGYDVWAEVKGPVEQLSAERGIRLWSRPDLPAVEVLSLVLFGFTQSEINQTSSSASGAVAAAGGLDFLTRATGVDKELRRALPKQVVDEFYLTSRTPRGVTRGVQASVPAVVVGTELWPGTRLRFTSTLLDPAGNNTDQAVELEQRWTKHLSGQLSWQRSSALQQQYGDVGADIRYRWEF